MNKFFQNKLLVATLVLPAVLVLVFAIFVPIGYSVYFSLTNWTGLGQPHVIGFDNYVTLITNDSVFWKSLFHAFLLLLVTVFIQNPVAFILAAVLSNIKQRVSQVFRTFYFIPAVLSVVVVTALWTNIFNPNYGILNKFLALFGLGANAPAWLADPATAVWSVIWIIIWQGFGWALLFYYTGLMTVPKDLIEAARVDGAGRMRTYFRVVIPFMLPTISAVIVIDVISCLKQMEIIYLSTQGGPGDLTQFVAVYLYQKAFNYSEYGYGNAISVLFIIFAVGLTALVQRLLRTKDENY